MPNFAFSTRLMPAVQNESENQTCPECNPIVARTCRCDHRRDTNRRLAATRRDVPRLFPPGTARTQSYRPLRFGVRMPEQRSKTTPLYIKSPKNLNRPK